MRLRDLASGVEHVVAGETRSIDDQVEWLDDDPHPQAVVEDWPDPPPVDVAQLRQAFLLPQGARQLGLHRFQCLFRSPQLVDVGVGLDHTPGVLGRFGVGLHMKDHAADR